MLDILFVTDYVCPYCLLAKEALKRALEKTGLEAKITYQPLLLKPKPTTGFRPDDPEVVKRFEALTSAALALDIDMKLPVRVQPRPYTQKAFEGWRYACGQGKGDEYADRMYRAYFVEEKDIANLDTLKSLAESVGLNADSYAEALADGRYARSVEEADRASRDVYQVKGVPTLFINGERTELDEYSVDEMVGILLGHSAAEGGMICVEDGCCQ